MELSLAITFAAIGLTLSGIIMSSMAKISPGLFLEPRQILVGLKQRRDAQLLSLAGSFCLIIVGNMDGSMAFIILGIVLSFLFVFSWDFWNGQVRKLEDRINF